MKRQLSGAAVALLLASGALASACNVDPPAATVNGTDISEAALNNQLQTLEGTQDGGCLLQIQNPQLSTTPLQGAAGSGTYTQYSTSYVVQITGTGTVTTSGSSTRFTAFGTNLDLLGQQIGTFTTFRETAPAPQKGGTFTLA